MKPTALIIGFPIALIIAWAFESTPRGIRTEAAMRRGNNHGGGVWIFHRTVGPERGQR